jgi:hypothetical protein
MEYYESQRFRQWWLWLIVVIAASLPVIILAVEHILDKSLSDHPTTLREVLITTAFSAVGLLLVASMKLETRINGAGVHYRFVPFHFSYQSILWEEVAEAYIREYSPLREYGGWGIRYGLGKSGRAYNVSGNMGLQLVLRSGKRVLIGTRQPEQIQEILHKLKKGRGRAEV